MKQNPKKTPEATQEKPVKKEKIRGSFVTLFLAVLVIIGVVVVITKPWEKAIDPAGQDRFDLTEMPGTLVYLQVHDMINVKPAAYVDKTVKAQGALRVASTAAGDKYYVVIRDAEACCAQGIEFGYTGEIPAAGTTVTVDGVFQAYEESGGTRYRIAVCTLNAE